MRKYVNTEVNYPFSECYMCEDDCSKCKFLHPEQSQTFIECKICKTKKKKEIYYLDNAGGLRICNFCPECGQKIEQEI